MAQERNQQTLNSQEIELIGSMIWGVIFLISGISRMRNFKATVKTIVGGYLLYRGVSGYCKINNAASQRSWPNEVEAVSEINETNAFRVSGDPTLG